MVERRMGLLDDAIREHLELKRLRGADPGLVSREESDVFGPVRAGEPETDGGTPESPPRGDASPAEHDPSRSEGFSNVGQETAEIDMQTVLEAESGGDAPPTGPATTAPVAARPRSGDASLEGRPIDDSLEWEVPGESAAEESDREDMASDESQEELVEDVLEETPEFLRDTPEQERLWFEQRPPRDFDFDK
jgi:hypothetical protein